MDHFWSFLLLLQQPLSLEGQSKGGCAPPLLSKQRSNLNNRSANLEEMSENSGFQDVDQVDVREGKGLSGNASLDVLGCTKEMLIMLKQVVQTQAQQEEKMLVIRWKTVNNQSRVHT
ncbi:hypothetical protein FF1_039886 [Malus domestica]